MLQPPDQSCSLTSGGWTRLSLRVCTFCLQRTPHHDRLEPNPDFHHRLHQSFAWHFRGPPLINNDVGRENVRGKRSIGLINGVSSPQHCGE
jgi:hypothetical protein